MDKNVCNTNIFELSSEITYTWYRMIFVRRLAIFQDFFILPPLITHFLH